MKKKETISITDQKKETFPILDRKRSKNTKREDSDFEPEVRKTWFDFESKKQTQVKDPERTYSIWNQRRSKVKP